MDGESPSGTIVVDQQGDLFGIVAGGINDSVFELLVMPDVDALKCVLVAIILDGGNSPQSVPLTYQMALVTDTSDAAATRTAAAAPAPSERQIFIIVRRLRAADDDTAVLLPGRSAGGRDKSRFAPVIEKVIQQFIARSPEDKSIESSENIVSDIRRQCGNNRLSPLLSCHNSAPPRYISDG